MECRKWEEVGLLSSAQELDSRGMKEFEAHLEACEECRSELSLYRHERTRFFTQEILGEAPSAKVSAEILRVCADQRSAKADVAKISFFPVFFRKALMPVALFVIGFISVGYIMMNMENAKAMKTASVQEHKATGASAAAAATQVAVQNAADTLKDSLRNPNFAKTRGNLNDNGVFPVDLKK
jgi:hypothetical protein